MPDPKKLSFARLVDWIEGRLPDDEAQTIAEQAAAADAATLADITWLHQFREVSANIVLAAPPVNLRAQLVQRFEEHVRARRGTGLLQRLIATLSFDSDMQPGLQGVRTAGVQEPQRQFVYSTAIADIVLHVQPRPHDRNLDVSGQAFPKRDVVLSNFAVALLQGDQIAVGGVADNLGEFTFESVAPGLYQMILRTDQVELLIATVELRT